MNPAALTDTDATVPASPSPDDAAALVLVLGIGCRRGVSLAQIEAAVRLALDGRTLAGIGAVATLDAKADEPALVAFCAAHALPLHAYARERLATLPGPAALSPAARARFGVDGVAEPCARLAAGGGPLWRGKLAHDGVTVAVAVAAGGAAPHRNPALSPSPNDHR